MSGTSRQTLVIPLGTLAIGFPGSTYGSGPLARTALRGLLVMLPKLHLPVDALPLKLLLQHPKGLIDIVVTDDDLHNSTFDQCGAGTMPRLKVPAAVTRAKCCRRMNV